METVHVALEIMSKIIVIQLLSPSFIGLESLC